MAYTALQGLTVIELGEMITAPYCGKLLAGMGARVIKIEPPGWGDKARRYGPFLGDVPGSDRSGLFLYLNADKQGITLDIATPTGADLFRKLLQRADILIENTTPGDLDSLGLGFEQLIEVQPKLIMTSITPFGQTGPYARYAADDLICFQMSGIGYLTPSEVVTPEEEQPLQAGSRQADFLAGLAGSLGTLHGLFARDATEEPQHVDVSEQEAMATIGFVPIAWYTYEGKETSRLKFQGEVVRHETLLRCKDGYFMFRAGAGHHWSSLVKLMGNPAWASDEFESEAGDRSANWHVITAHIEEWAKDYTKEEIYRAAQAMHIPLFPVNSMQGVFQSAQLDHRGYFVKVTHPEVGTLRYPGLPFRMEKTWVEDSKPAPRLGEHNRDVYVELLGLQDADVVGLWQAGVI